MCQAENPHGVSVGVESVELDGAMVPLNEITLQADETLDEIRIVLGNESPAREDETVNVALDQPQRL